MSDCIPLDGGCAHGRPDGPNRPQVWQVPELAQPEDKRVGDSWTLCWNKQGAFLNSRKGGEEFRAEEAGNATANFLG